MLVEEWKMHCKEPKNWIYKRGGLYARKRAENDFGVPLKTASLILMICLRNNVTDLDEIWYSRFTFKCFILFVLVRCNLLYVKIKLDLSTFINTAHSMKSAFKNPMKIILNVFDVVGI